MIKRKYLLGDAELHTAWILRKYIEQSKIPNFDALNYAQRRQAIEQWRRAELLRLQKSGKNAQFKQQRKSFRHTGAYVHLTHAERSSLMDEVAATAAGWGAARMFAECVDKVTFSPANSARTPDEEALEQIVSRFESYLRGVSAPSQNVHYGLLIHDNNETVSKKHTALVRGFHKKGTLWGQVNHIMETPFFVNSELTSMVQIADLCAYAIRRHLENKENRLLDLLMPRAERRGSKIVGLRHFTSNPCACRICEGRGRNQQPAAVAQ